MSKSTRRRPLPPFYLVLTWHNGVKPYEWNMLASRDIKALVRGLVDFILRQDK